MADISFPENQLRFAEPELAERIEAEIRAAALVQGEEPPLRCRILRREWNAPRGRLTIQLGRPGWVTNFAVPESPPGQVREAVTQVLAGHGVPVLASRRDRERLTPLEVLLQPEPALRRQQRRPQVARLAHAGGHVAQVEVLDARCPSSISSQVTGVETAACGCGRTE